MVKYKELSYMWQLKYEAERDEKKYRKWLKNWISEIIKLLNEWSEYEEKEYGFRNYEWVLSIRWPQAKRLCIPNEYLSTEESEVIIVSKSYGFIKWLVDNDKIDTFRILEKRFDTQKWYEREHYHTVNEWNTDLLLMLLSISDSPIDDLISYLK